jgi:DNA-binding LacI/PurR family transcriptional regulator
MKRPTQKDVARRAGVSRSTVSYVLNDQTQLKIPISDETRQRVLDAIDELGYEPDARAQSLRLGHTNIVGVIIPVIQNPFSGRFCPAFPMACRKQVIACICLIIRWIYNRKPTPSDKWRASLSMGSSCWQQRSTCCPG